MKIKQPLIAFLLILILPALLSAKLFKWTDENGKVHFGDRIPLKYQKKESIIYDKSGIIIEKRAAARDPAELQREAARKRQIEKLRREAQMILKKQQAEDRKLLKKYQNEDEIILYRDGKLKAVDNQIDMTKININRLKRLVAESQKMLAARERQGIAASDKLQKQVNDYQQQIEDYYISIVRNKEQKQIIFEKSDKELQHFRKLKRLSSHKRVGITSKNTRESLKLNDVVVCKSTKRCKKYWARAVQYLKKYTNLPISVMGERIIMTARPIEKNDISLTLSRNLNPTTNTTRIFLDVQCSPTVEGSNLCRSAKINAIKNNFQSTIKKR